MKYQTYYTYYCDCFVSEFDYCSDKKEATKKFKTLYKAENLEEIFGKYYPELLTVSNSYLGKRIGD